MAYVLNGWSSIYIKFSCCYISIFIPYSKKKWPDKVVKSIRSGKIGSPIMIYVFYLKDYYLQSPSSRSYCSQVFSRATAQKTEEQPFTKLDLVVLENCARM